jgi:hypothetical protein
MGIQYLDELAEKLHDLQERTRGTVENEKVRVMGDVVLECVRTMREFDDRLRTLEGKDPSQ